MRLSRAQRISARNNILLGSDLMLRHPAEIHYTQGAARWEGISHHLRVVHGQFPRHGDCSSTATWMVWNALTHALETVHIPDVVNGENWWAGFTGTMVRHGMVVHGGPHLVGDCCFYGPGPDYEHVTVYIGGGFVFSHGGEAGPFKLPTHYRGDMATVRRYILAP